MRVTDRASVKKYYTVYPPIPNLNLNSKNFIFMGGFLFPSSNTKPETVTKYNCKLYPPLVVTHWMSSKIKPHYKWCHMYLSVICWGNPYSVLECIRSAIGPPVSLHLYPASDVWCRSGVIHTKHWFQNTQNWRTPVSFGDVDKEQ